MKTYAILDWLYAPLLALGVVWIYRDTDTWPAFMLLFLAIFGLSTETFKLRRKFAKLEAKLGIQSDD